MKTKLSLLVLIHMLVLSVNSGVFKSPNSDDANYWRKHAEKHLQKVLDKQGINSVNVVKNVIYFVGDGMSVATIAAGRIFKGQLNKNAGEETELVFESFPHLGMAKTYNINKQVPDSAATATALFTGVKSAYKTLGLNPATENSTQTDRLPSIMDWAQATNKRTGIVTTTRVSHATPAGTYAYSTNRAYECDTNVPEHMKNSFKDISLQLVENSPGKNFNVIFGGGRLFLGAPLPEQNDTVKFKGNAQKTCTRSDGRNLTHEWLENRSNAKYVGLDGWIMEIQEELKSIDLNNIDYVLGLFANNHMSYNSLRNREANGEPSLTDMTKAAIKILNNKNNENGFVLMVEGGKIDQAHHQNLVRMALEETVEFENAIEEAVKMSGEDTLIIVTSDHGHSMVFNGHAERGNDILGLTKKENSKLYETIAYATGPGFWNHKSNQTNETFVSPGTLTNRMEPTYASLSAVGLSDAAHSGEDVAVFATGKGSNLIQGVFEQNYIAYCISYATCIGPVAYKNPLCLEINRKNESSQIKIGFLSLIVLQIHIAIFKFYSMKI
ncbi:unnamed protein product [Diamesa hyperborea]